VGLGCLECIPEIEDLADGGTGIEKGSEIPFCLGDVHVVLGAVLAELEVALDPRLELAVLEVSLLVWAGDASLGVVTGDVEAWCFI
jgi:hypothetical protein